MRFCDSDIQKFDARRQLNCKVLTNFHTLVSSRHSRHSLNEQPRSGS